VVTWTVSYEIGYYKCKLCIRVYTIVGLGYTINLYLRNYLTLRAAFFIHCRKKYDTFYKNFSD